MSNMFNHERLCRQRSFDGCHQLRGPAHLAHRCTNALGFFKEGAYWRYLGLLAVATFDIRTALRPDHPTFLSAYLNPFLASTNLRPRLPSLPNHRHYEKIRHIAYPIPHSVDAFVPR